MSDERNFRSVYYGKVGFKGIEEKKSLEIILKEEPIDKVKLSQFCLKFPVPISYRHYIWLIALGVLPCHQYAHPVALEQRKLQFDDLKRALEVMHKIDEDTKTEIVFLKMYLIEEKILPFDETYILDRNKNFVFIARIMIDLIADPVQGFWLSVKFTNLIEMGTKHVNSFIGEIESILKRESNQLFKHMSQYNIFESIPFHGWISSGFASIFQAEYLEKIWDRIIGGGFVYLSYLCAGVLMAHTRQILGFKSSQETVKVLDEIGDDYMELSATLAHDLWNKDGCPLEPQFVDTPVCKIVTNTEKSHN